MFDCGCDDFCWFVFMIWLKWLRFFGYVLFIVFILVDELYGFLSVLVVDVDLQVFCFFIECYLLGIMKFISLDFWLSFFYIYEWVVFGY